MLLHGYTSTPLLNLLCINLRFFSQGVQEYVCVSLLELTVPDMILKKAKGKSRTIIYYLNFLEAAVRKSASQLTHPALGESEMRSRCSVG